MPARRGDDELATGLSGPERSAIEGFLVYIEDRVRDVEPVCAKLVQMARLALSDPDILKDEERLIH